MATVTEPKELVKVPELPEAVVRRGIDISQWNTLCKSLYPGANPNSVVLVIDYCKARKLDPMKKPCHIVPMSVKDPRTGKYEYRDVVMPGIYEYRTTAQRTGEYLGHSVPEYGPPIKIGNVTAPEWCAMTIFRWNPAAKQKVEFPVRVLLREVIVCKSGTDTPNDRWTRATVQMLTKCTEAAGLREAFPDHLGGEHTAEEMAGRGLDGDDPIVASDPITMPRRVADTAPMVVGVVDDMVNGALITAINVKGGKADMTDEHGVVYQLDPAMVEPLRAGMLAMKRYDFVAEDGKLIEANPIG